MVELMVIQTEGEARRKEEGGRKRTETGGRRTETRPWIFI
jgi:hypothetical protein